MKETTPFFNGGAKASLVNLEMPYNLMRKGFLTLYYTVWTTLCHYSPKDILHRSSVGENR